MFKEKVERLAFLNSKLDPYYNQIDGYKITREFSDEFDEMIEALESGDLDELEKELGDLYWTFMFMMHKFEDEGKIKIENVYKKIYDKMVSRKSFLLEERKVTKEEAVKIWNEAKKKEGYGSDRLWDNKRDER